MSVRVLLIDEREETRTTLAKRLRRSERVEVVGAVSDVAQASEFTNHRLDVVLVDVHGTDGEDRDLCQEVSQTFAPPVVVLASYMTEERWAGLKQVGVSTYLLRRADARGLALDLVAIATDLSNQRRDSNTHRSGP